ncbi:unnamed protein product [Leuciscus chuanchicus]
MKYFKDNKLYYTRSGRKAVHALSRSLRENDKETDRDVNGMDIASDTSLVTNQCGILDDSSNRGELGSRPLHETTPCIHIDVHITISSGHWSVFRRPLRPLGVPSEYIDLDICSPHPKYPINPYPPYP